MTFWIFGLVVDFARSFDAVLVALGLTDIYWCPVAHEFCFVAAEYCVPGL